MSTNNRILVMIGLTVVGSLGWATVREPADEPQRPESPLGNMGKANVVHWLAGRAAMSLSNLPASGGPAFSAAASKAAGSIRLNV